MNQTKESIALAKELHELGVRFEPIVGKWLSYDGGTPMLIHKKTRWWLHTYGVAFKRNDSHVIILPSIHDCLEWLRGKGYDRIEIKVFWNETQVEIRHASMLEFPKYETAKTPLEALLKAMIQVAKEG